MKPRIWVLAALAVLVLIGGGIAWALRPGEPAEVKRVKEIANKMFDEETTDEQRQELREQMREIRDTIPEDQRREAFREMGNQFRERMMDHMREFASLPEDQRNEFLDKDIDRMEGMRREWEQRRAERERDGNASEGGGPRGGGPGFGPPGRGGPGGGGRPRTEEEREQRRRARLDNTTAEDRAYFTEYIKAVNKRREERGLEPMRRGPFGRGPR